MNFVVPVASSQLLPGDSWVCSLRETSKHGEDRTCIHNGACISGTKTTYEAVFLDLVY